MSKEISDSSILLPTMLRVSPSIYISYSQGLAVQDHCGGIGSSYSAPLLSLAPGDISTWPLPDVSAASPGDKITAPGLLVQAPLTIADLECPSRGVGRSDYTDIMTVANWGFEYIYGPPYLSLIAQLNKMLDFDPTWRSLCTGLETFGPVQHVGLLDPPRALVPGANLAAPTSLAAVNKVDDSPQPAQKANEQGARPTAVPMRDSTVGQKSVPAPPKAAHANAEANVGANVEANAGANAEANAQAKTEAKAKANTQQGPNKPDEAHPVSNPLNNDPVNKKPTVLDTARQPAVAPPPTAPEGGSPPRVQDQNDRSNAAKFPGQAVPGPKVDDKKQDLGIQVVNEPAKEAPKPAPEPEGNVDAGKSATAGEANVNVENAGSIAAIFSGKAAAAPQSNEVKQDSNVGVGHEPAKEPPKPAPGNEGLIDAGKSTAAAAAAAEGKVKIKTDGSNAAKFPGQANAAPQSDEGKQDPNTGFANEPMGNIFKPD